MTRWTKEEIKQYNATHNFDHYAQDKGWKHTDRHCPICDLNCPVSNKYPDRRFPKDKTKKALMDWDRPNMFHENVCPAVLTSREIETNHAMLEHNNQQYFEVLELMREEQMQFEGFAKLHKFTSDEIIASIRARGIHFYGWDEFYDEHNRMKEPKEEGDVWVKEEFTQNAGLNFVLSAAGNELKSVSEIEEEAQAAANIMPVDRIKLIEHLGQLKKVISILTEQRDMVVNLIKADALEKHDKENERYR